MKVWKFPLSFDQPSRAKMPMGAQVIHFAMQGDVPTIWAVVDPMQPSRWRDFAIIGTGHDGPFHATYVGTAFHGPFVWHCFELPATYI